MTITSKPTKGKATDRSALSGRSAKPGRSLGPVRALGLCSGGLDSMLAALVLKDQGIDVSWVTFETPFFNAANARRAASLTAIPLTVKDITGPYLEMLKHPRCGYGRNMNPCMDCHALMLQVAGSMMNAEGFGFLFTGEVVGQRPMSQTKPSLRYVEKNSGYDGYILRPLSAKLLPLTIPEEQGLVDRERLLDISGRSRKRQMALAESFGITDYPAPGGGCLLTDPRFSGRVRDLLDRQQSVDARDFELLKQGRHFRLDDAHKAIVGRTQEDNNRIARLADPNKDVLLHMADRPGPTVLLPGGGDEHILHQAAALCAAYSKAKPGTSARVTVVGPGGAEVVTIAGATREQFRALLI